MHSSSGDIVRIYLMPTSTDVDELLSDIRDEMATVLGVSDAEAVARINQQWQGQDLSGDDEIVLHEDGYFWALSIYFGGNVPDWSPDADRSNWMPKPAPPRDSPCWTLPD